MKVFEPIERYSLMKRTVPNHFTRTCSYDILLYVHLGPGNVYNVGDLIVKDFFSTSTIDKLEALSMTSSIV